MEQSLSDAFNQCTVITVYDKERIKNLVANLRFARASYDTHTEEGRVVFVTSRKGKPDQVTAYTIKGAYLTDSQIALLMSASLKEKK